MVRAAPPVADAERVSFDGGFRGVQRVTRPDRYRQLEQLPTSARRIVQGGGYSYAAASFGAGSLVEDGRPFDRVLAFDPSQGILECEAGATLGKIFALASRDGWYLPVQPGYPHITIGGCIAAAVHGKNPARDGTFRTCVAGLTLFHADHGVLKLQPGDEAFELTCGGLGLTGRILSARLQLARLPGPRVRVLREDIDRIGDTAEILGERFRQASFIYTWHNLTARGSGLGRGFLYWGEFVPGQQPFNGLHYAWPIDAQSRARLRFQWLNRYTTCAFNAGYHLWQRGGRRERQIGLFDALFPVARKVLYFELFGRRGFHEYQMLVPTEAVATFLKELTSFLRRQPVPVTLASCKLFAGTQWGLRFCGSGLSVALDFPRDAASAKFATFLDGLVCDLRALPNLVKDSRLPLHVVRSCFPDYEAFRTALSHFDPRRRYASELSERLAL